MRKLIAIWLLSVFALPAAAANVTTEEFTYDVDGVKLTGYLAFDAAVTGKRPGVLVVHEWWGHTDYVRQRARQLAELGYTALALDMYGDGKVADHPDNAKKFMMEVFSNMEAGAARFKAAKKILEDHATTDPAKTAAVGYCFGGAIVLGMARSGMDLKGVAAFHAGSLATKTPAAPGVVKAKVFVADGEADPYTPAEDVAAFKKEMNDAGVDLTFISYPGVRHAFTNPEADENRRKFGGEQWGYDEAADTDSWAKLRTFLVDVFK